MKKKEMKVLRKEIIDAGYYVVNNANAKVLEEWIRKLPLEVIVDFKETIDYFNLAKDGIRKRKERG